METWSIASLSNSQKEVPERSLTGSLRANSQSDEASRAYLETNGRKGRDKAADSLSISDREPNRSQNNGGMLNQAGNRACGEECVICSKALKDWQEVHLFLVSHECG